MVGIDPSFAVATQYLLGGRTVRKTEERNSSFTARNSLSYTPRFILVVEKVLSELTINRNSTLGWTRIGIVIVGTAFPVVFAKRIEEVNLWFVIGFVLLVAIGAVVEYFYDREAEADLESARSRAEAELENARRRLQLQVNAGPTMAKLLAVVEIASVGAAPEKRSSFTDEERAAFAKGLEQSIVEVLKAVCASVWTYWNASGSVTSPFYGSVMRAYNTETCGPAKLAELKSRAQFLQYKRDDLKSYKHVLDGMFWSDTNPQFVPIAIPVEDETSVDGMRLLLPGAPTAYATGQDVIISDTEDFEHICGPELS